MSIYAEDIKKYVANVEEKAVTGIVKHLGIALKGKDTAMVSCSSKDELARIRESWCKKKLSLTAADAELDKGLKEICEKMKGDKTKHRVTFYYLVAEKYGKLPSIAG